MNLRLFLLRLDKIKKAFLFSRLRKAWLNHCVLAASEHKPILNDSYRTVIDIGANRGQFSLAARQWAPKARVIGFEPLSKPANTFRRVFDGDHMVTLHQTAIGPESGAVRMHVAESDDSSSILPISIMQEKTFAGSKEIRVESVDVKRLSDCITAQEITPPALLKLDVQGYELQTLKGCEELLPRFSNVYAECSFLELYEGQALACDVIEWLSHRSFLLEGIYNTCYSSSGVAIQGDMLFRSTVFEPNDATEFRSRSSERSAGIL